MAPESTAPTILSARRRIAESRISPIFAFAGGSSPAGITISKVFTVVSWRFGHQSRELGGASRENLLSRALVTPSLHTWPKRLLTASMTACLERKVTSRFTRESGWLWKASIALLRKMAGSAWRNR